MEWSGARLNIIIMFKFRTLLLYSIPLRSIRLYSINPNGALKRLRGLKVLVKETIVRKSLKNYK
jgi:hypothetical protein